MVHYAVFLPQLYLSKTVIWVSGDPFALAATARSLNQSSAAPLKQHHNAHHQNCLAHPAPEQPTLTRLQDPTVHALPNANPTSPQTGYKALALLYEVSSARAGSDMH